MYIRSKLFEGKTDKEAEHYNTKYSIEPLSEELKNIIKNPKSSTEKKKLGHPPQNNLIAKNFDVLPEKKEMSAKPFLLKSWDECTDLWYKKDDKFERPKAAVSCKIYTNDCLWV